MKLGWVIKLKISRPKSKIFVLEFRIVKFNNLLELILGWYFTREGVTIQSI